VDAAVALVRRRTGLVIGESRRQTFETALVEAMCSAGVHDPVAYLAGLAGTPALMDELAGRCTIGETYFLREPEQLNVIEREVFPERLGAAGGRRLRLWSAGCATGEEAYTLAMLVGRCGALDRVEIVGTDISRTALEVARAARYRAWSFRGVPPEIVAAYFRRSGEVYELDPALRRPVAFRYLNLASAIEEWSAAGISGMDLILCRNVLIYFDRETVARVAAGLIASLAEDGWLLLGPSDPLIGDLVPCSVLLTRSGLCYRRPGAGRASSQGAAELEWAPPRERPAVEAPPPPLVEVRPMPAADGAEAEPGSLRRTAESAESGAESDRGSEAAAVAAVRALADRGALPQAERACEAALEHHGMSPELHLLHALLLNAAGQFEAGAVAARKALYLDRSLAMGHVVYGAALAGVGDRPAARAAFAVAASVLANAPRNAVVPASGGESAGRLADLVRAELEMLIGAAA